MTELAWLGPDEQRTFRAYAKSTRALFVQFDRELQAEVGLPRTYFEILWLLDAAPEGGMRMSDLAAATGSQASRITYAVTRLEKAGQVRRELCVEDRRGWYAVLADAGREMLSRAAPHYAAMVRRYFLGPLSVAQREQVVEVGELILGELARSAPTIAAVGADDAPVGGGRAGSGRRRALGTATTDRWRSSRSRVQPRGPALTERKERAK